MKKFYKFIFYHINQFEEIVFKKLNLLILSLLSLTYIIIIYGLGQVPYNPVYLISQNPFINLIPDNPKGFYLYDSILIPIFTYFTGINKNQFIFLLFNFLIILLAIITLILLTKKYYSLDTSKLILLIFIVNPLSVILFTWIGYYDSLTFLLQVFLIFTNNLIGLLIIGLLGGLNHFPIMLFSGITFLLFKLVAENKHKIWQPILTYLIGLGLGYLTVKIYQQWSNLGLTVDRLSYLKLVTIQEMINYLGNNFFSLIFSLYNILWIVIIFIFYYLFNHQKNLFYIFLSSNFLYLLLTATTLDSTRIFSLLSFPLLIYSILYIQNNYQKKSLSEYLSLRHFLSGIIILGLFIPRIYIWEGKIYFSVSWSFFMQIIDIIKSFF